VIIISDKEEVAHQQYQLKYIYYNRLHITILRNGITFYADIRDRAYWHSEMLRWGETTVMVEDDITSTTLNKMITLMNEFKWTSQQANGFMYTLTGQRHNLKIGQMYIED
jgi:hypothetical protein